MSELVAVVLTAIITSILSPIIVSRLSKTKQERKIELAERLSQITDKTSAQLFEYLERLDRLEGEAALREDERRKRDQRISELEVELTTLKKQIEQDARETEELRARYDELKKFTKSLIVALEKKGIQLPELNGGLPESISKWKWPEGKP